MGGRPDTGLQGHQGGIRCRARESMQVANRLCGRLAPHLDGQGDPRPEPPGLRPHLARGVRSHGDHAAADRSGQVARGPWRSSLRHRQCARLRVQAALRGVVAGSWRASRHRRVQRWETSPPERLLGLPCSAEGRRLFGLVRGAVQGGPRPGLHDRQARCLWPFGRDARRTRDWRGRAAILRGRQGRCARRQQMVRYAGRRRRTRHFGTGGEADGPPRFHVEKPKPPPLRGEHLRGQHCGLP
mmetsp:Transcript_21126/g.52914  ORF Transcript_21126/g.52914 Transcript_21126/m.52914 type:complete len:242 (+) Transcript_21126:1778-2503(+)